MGRPRKDATTQDVRERLIVAMADRLIREPASAVTVTSLIKEVGCNRSTFYYYFADTEQLAEAALDAVVPVEIPRALLSLIRQGAFSLSPATPNIPDLVQRNAQGIDTLCAVLNGPNAALAQKRVKRRLLEDVLPDLGVSLSSNTDDPTSRIVFEYATGGLLALMAAACGLAVAGRVAATLALADMGGAHNGRKFVDIHFGGPPYSSSVTATR